MRYYTVSKDDYGRWYCHMVGFSYVPVFGSFSKKKHDALQWAANSMALTYKDYMVLRKSKPELFA